MASRDDSMFKCPLCKKQVRGKMTYFGGAVFHPSCAEKRFGKNRRKRK